MPHASTPRHLFVAALAIASFLVFGAASATSAGAAARVSSAVAIGASKPVGDGADCARQARRAMRAMATGSAASRRRQARRARASKRRCADKLRGAKPPVSLIDPNAGPLTIAVDGHYAGWTYEIEDRAALGAAVTRHEWELDNPVESEEQQVIEGATEIDTRVHALLGGNDIGEAGAYRDYVVDFVRYWGPGGRFWDEHPELDESRYAITSIELGNEPYFGEMSPEEYAETVRPTLEAVAGLGVPVKVILPSYIHGERTTWIDTLYERIPGLNGLFHAFADHPYWYAHHPAEEGDNGPFERIDTLRERMAYHGAGDKPLYITEYGESTASCGEECVDEATQAEHLQAMIDAVVSRSDWGVEMLSVFQLRDRGTESGDREEQFGLLREDGSPKPAYAIVRDAMQRYRG